MIKRYMNRNSWFFCCLSYLDIVCTLLDSFFFLSFIYCCCAVRLVVPPLCLIDISIFPSVCCFSSSFDGLFFFLIVCLSAFVSLDFRCYHFSRKMCLSARMCVWASVNLMATTMIWPSKCYYNRSHWCGPCVFGWSECCTVECVKSNNPVTIEITWQKKKNFSGSRFHSHPEFISVVACPFGICLFPPNCVCVLCVLTTKSSWRDSNEWQKNTQPNISTG